MIGDDTFMKKLLRKLADVGVVSIIAIFGGLLMIVTAVHMLIKKVKNK